VGDFQILLQVVFCSLFSQFLLVWNRWFGLAVICFAGRGGLTGRDEVRHSKNGKKTRSNHQRYQIEPSHW
jgi:hypothetical protein